MAHCLGVYAHREPAQLPPSPFNAHPSFARSYGPCDEFDPYSSFYDPPVVSPASSVSSLASLLIRHRDEPDCVAAIECIREVESAMGLTSGRTYVGQHLRPVSIDMKSALMAAHQLLTDCEERRLMEEMWRAREAERRAMELQRLVMATEGQTLVPMDLKRDLFAIIRRAFGDDTNPAVMARLQASPPYTISAHRSFLC